MKLVRADYQVENGIPVIYLFCRENDKRVIRKVKNFRSYFYISVDEKNKIKNIEKDPNEYFSIYGEKLIKVYTPLPSDVPELRDRYNKTWEADILFQNRYLIDEVESLEYVKQKIAYLDIETNNSGRVPSAEIAKEEIICISVYIDDIFTSFVFRKDLSEGISHKLFENSLNEIRYFRSEKSMLDSFLTYFVAEEPDILTGWNSSRFDIPYIVNRMRRLGVDYKKLSPIGSVYTREQYEIMKGQGVVIKGLSFLDMYDTYKWLVTQQQGQEESYKLDFIGKKVLGVGKNESSDNIKWLWTTNIDRLVQYNVNDCSLLVKIDEKLRLIDFVDEMRRLCFCNLEDALVISRIADSYILRMFHNKIVFPTKTQHDKHEFEGAFVDSWGKGVYKIVVVFDLKSLYPSTIYTLNLSPETMSDIPVENSICVDGIYIRQDKVGFLPQVIGELFKERTKYKTLMSKEVFDSQAYKNYDARQYSIKTLLNALYGQTAFSNSRIYDHRVAKTTTFIGREINEWSRNFITEIGYTVLYADTDSCHWVLDTGIDLSQILLIQELLNNSYGNFAKKFGITNHIFNIEFEKIYKRAFYSGKKKRYAGAICYKGGKEIDKLETWGLETRRSDSSQFSRKMLETVLNMLLREDKSKEEITRYIGGEIDRIRNGNYKYSEIGIPKGIQQALSDYKSPGSNVKGAIYSKKVLGLDLSSKPKMLYVSRIPDNLPQVYKFKKEEIQVETICFDEDKQVPPGTVIDIEKMLEKIVKDKLKGIFEALGWSMKELDYHWAGKASKSGKQMELTL